MSYQKGKLESTLTDELWNRQAKDFETKEPKRKYFLAFPGLGKSYLAFNDYHYFDADFGIFREFTSGKTDADTCGRFIEWLSKITIYEHAIVLTNEPLLANWMIFEKMFLPSEHLISRCAKKLGVSEDQCTEWVHGWEETAKRCGIPIIYIEKSLLWYLRFGL